MRLLIPYRELQLTISNVKDEPTSKYEYTGFALLTFSVIHVFKKDWYGIHNHGTLPLFY